MKGWGWIGLTRGIPVSSDYPLLNGTLPPLAVQYSLQAPIRKEIQIPISKQIDQAAQLLLFAMGFESNSKT